MNSTPLISVIVPTYNAGRYLGELCQSLQQQTVRDFEVLIGDDGSTDNTREVIQPFLADQRFRMLGWSTNKGVHQATMALLVVARGDFWCNPGADDVLEADFFERRLTLLEAHPEAILAHGPPQLIDSASKSLAATADWDRIRCVWQQLPPQVGAPRSLELLLQHNFLNTPGVFARLSMTRLVTPFFTGSWQYAQDWYYWILMAALGFDILWDPHPSHRYRMHSQSLSQTSEKEAVRQAEIRLVPLTALSVASRYSGTAAQLWLRWRDALYGLWLTRAARLQVGGRFRNEWLQIAAHAYYGGCHSRVSLGVELVRHGCGLPATCWWERHSRRQQVFCVSGLAAIQDPLFRRAES